jgi:hypothetical protein
MHETISEQHGLEKSPCAHFVREPGLLEIAIKMLMYDFGEQQFRMGPAGIGRHVVADLFVV